MNCFEELTVTLKILPRQMVGNEDGHSGLGVTERSSGMYVEAVERQETIKEGELLPPGRRSNQQHAA